MEGNDEDFGGVEEESCGTRIIEKGMQMEGRARPWKPSSWNPAAASDTSTGASAAGTRIKETFLLSRFNLLIIGTKLLEGPYQNQTAIQ
jgi:hypothetical protein